MTTDNRTNEPTEAQVEAAAKALYANKTGSERGFEHTLFRRTWLQTARIALVAAAGVAPQAESGHDWMTWEESGKNGTYCRNCGIWAGKSGGVACAPVQPSNTVDEAALADKLKHWIFQYNQERITLKTFARAIVDYLTGGTK